MNTLINIIGYISTAISIAMYAPQTWKTVKSKDTSSLSKPMFLAIFTGCMLWLVWAVLKGGLVPVWITQIGIALLMIPIIYYLFINLKILSIALIAIVVSALIFAITYTAIGTGTLSAGADIAIISIASSLTTFCWVPQIIEIFKTKNVSGISIVSYALILFNLTLLMAYYGMKLSDTTSDVALYIASTSCVIQVGFVGVIFWSKWRYSK